MHFKKLDQKSDEEIAKLVQNGSANSFGILIERYQDKLLRYGKKFLYNYDDVEDAVQEVFIRVYENIQSFNIKMKFSPWIYRIAHNTFINIIRKSKREPISFFDPDTFFARSIKANEDIESSANRQFDKAEVENHLKKLKPKYREPLVLYYTEEKSYQEISDILRIPVSTVGVRINRAKGIIKENTTTPLR
jgi:RNA polymerase sigma-70 factor (ECF subfamily)